MRALSCAAFALVIAACGARDTGGDTAPTLEPVAYTWDLPVIDTAADGIDGEMYQALRKGCDDGDRMITEKWQQSASPRNVLLFAAGVQACRGDMNQARTLFVRARDEYGFAGLGPVQDAARCDVYKSVASVLEKAPRDRFPCMDGASPAFRRAADGTPDNPLTAADESAVVATTAATSTAAPPTTAPSSPTRHPTTRPKPAPTATKKAAPKPPPAVEPAPAGGGKSDDARDDSSSKDDDSSDKNDNDDDKKDEKKKDDKDGDPMKTEDEPPEDGPMGDQNMT